MTTGNWLPKMTKAQYWENHKHIYNRYDKTDEEKHDAATALHREYYAQFIDDAYINEIVWRIGAERLRTSRNKDGCFNDIPLALWDSCPWPRNHRAHMKLCGDFPATFPVCEAKEAARQWYEREIEQRIAASLAYNTLA